MKKVSILISVLCLLSFTTKTYSQGTVFTWGYNSNGQLGNNSTTESNIPVQVLDSGGSNYLKGIIAVSGGDHHSFALKSDGTVWSWGGNANGQLGNNSTADSHIPVQVLDSGGSGYLTGITAISAGYGHSLALKSDGTVWAWGFNGNGELGTNSTIESNVPVQVLGAGGIGYLSGIVAIAGGLMSSLTLKSDGTVWDWGWNYYGQLGNNSITDSICTPVQVVGVGGIGYLSGITAIATGSGTHSLAVQNGPTAVEFTDLAQHNVMLNISPNPAYNKVAIDYSLSKGQDVVLSIYDVAGRTIKILLSGNQKAGSYRTEWDMTDTRGQKVAKGIYFIKIEVGKYKATKKLTILG